MQLIVSNGRTGKTPKCCDGGFGGNHPNCLPIEIPQEDHFYKLHKRRCMNFVRSKSTWIQRKNSIFLPRSQAGLRYNCRLGPREQFNEISAVLDAGTVYSNVPERLESLRCGSFFMMFSTKLLNKLEIVILILRLYKNGFMKTLPVFSEFNMRDLLPLKVFCSSSSTISWQLIT